MENFNIPKKLELSASDPYLRYLMHMYNCGIDYLVQSEKILGNVDEYQYNLNDYVRNTKLLFVLGKK